AASPFFDGARVYFLAGSAATFSFPIGIFVTNPSVWSVLPNGTDLRAEGRLEVIGALRIDGIWPDGRYLMHSGADHTQFLVGPRFAVPAPPSLPRVAVVPRAPRPA